MTGRLHTCYSPVRRSPAGKASFTPDAPRLACVKPVASVHPEPGSNSSLLFIFFFFFFFWIKSKRQMLKFVVCFRKIPNPRSCPLLAQRLCWLIRYSEIDSGHSFLMTLVLLLVYCKSFNVLSECLGLFPKSGAKLRRIFLPCKCFEKFFPAFFRHISTTPLSVSDLKLCCKTYF